MDGLDQVIEEQLSHLSSAEIAGSYRSLCGMMLVLTAIAFRRRSCMRKDEITLRATARKWLSNSGGVISFAEACDELNLDSDAAREAIESGAGR